MWRALVAAGLIWAMACIPACSRGALQSTARRDGGATGAGPPPDAAPEASNETATVGSTEPLVVLAEGQLMPAGIAVDQNNVYWLTLGQDQRANAKDTMPYAGGQVMKCAKDGCGGLPSVLASDRVQSIATRIPAGLATDGSAVYWADMTPLKGDAGDAIGHFFRCSADGCGGSPEVLGDGDDERLAVHGGYLIWTTFAASVSVCPTTGCGSGARDLWSAGYSPCDTGIAADDSGVYWTTASADIFMCPLTGCDNKPSVLMVAGAKQAVATNDLAIDNDFVYVTDSNPLALGMVLRCAKTGCGAQPVVLATGLNSPFGIVADGAHVYWIENDQVRACAVDGCNNNPTTLAAGAASLTALAVDAQFVYVAELGAGPSDGRIWRVSK
jgi:hypothetical protein